METGGGYLVRDGIFVSLEEVSKAIEIQDERKPTEKSFGRILFGLFRKKALVSFLKCIKEWVFVEENSMGDGDIRATFVKSGFISEGIIACLKDYDRSRNMTRVPRKGRYVPHEQRVFANHEFGAANKVMNSFLLVRGESDGGEELWVGKVLLLLQCSLKGQSEEV